MSPMGGCCIRPEGYEQGESLFSFFVSIRVRTRGKGDKK